MYKYLYIFFLAVAQLLFFVSKAQYTIALVDSSQQFVSFRGLSVVNDRVVWVSGSKGTVGLSIDGGKNWKWMHVPGFEKSDFRDIEAFDKNTAIIMASGTPAVILKTVDGGDNWKVVFRDNRPEMFLDAMDFWDEKRGMLVGDPINGRFVLLETTNGGDGWRMLDSTLCPEAHDSEAVFAASGTSLRWLNKYSAVFVTGGSTSRIVFYNVLSKTSVSGSQEMTTGQPSQGAFSFAHQSGKIIIVGGDYINDTAQERSFHYIDLFSFDRFATTPSGYRSGVEFINNKKRQKRLTVITVGTRGVDLCYHQSCYTSDCWICTQISTTGFHVVRKAKKGKAVFLAGGKGRIAKLNY